MRGTGTRGSANRSVAILDGGLRGFPQEPGGVVQFSGDTPADFTRLRPDVCTSILKFMRAPTTLRFDSAVALKVLAHESFHLQGIKTEAVAECYAMQAVPRLAHALGASELQGEAMAIAVWKLSVYRP